MNKKILIITISLFIILLIGIFSYLELMQSRKDLIDMAIGESFNLISTLKYSIENNIKTNEIIREKTLDNLYLATGFINHINEHKSMNSDKLSDYAINYNLDFIAIMSNNKIVSNISNLSIYDLDSILLSEMNILNTEDSLWIELGVHKIKGIPYYVTAGSYGSDRKIIITAIKDNQLLNLRKSIGIGRLIKNYSQNSDIVYVALQDNISIISATDNLIQLSDLEEDNFFDKIELRDKAITRIIDYDDKKVIESAILINDYDNVTVLRMGLSLDKVRSINQNNTIRTILLAFGLIIIFSIAAALVYQKANHQKLLEAHRQMIEYTGILLSNIKESIIGIDNSGKIILYNHKSEEIFGKVRLNENYVNIFPNDIFLLNRALKENQTIPYSEIEYYSKNGNKYILAFSTSIVKDINGKPDILISIIRDITSLRHQEEITRRNEKLSATGVLAAGVAHEIRNPMNSINIIAQRLEIEFEPVNDKDEYFSLIGTVRREIKRIDIIISQFLEFSKIKLATLKVDNLSDVIKKSTALMKHSANFKRIEIINEISNDLFIEMDSDKIEQVFINLFRNSIEAIGDGGIITISAKVKKDQIIISFKDTGPGITDDIKSKIFDLYFTTKSTGTGLGLGIVNKIMQEHNGKIYFESDNSNGTVFHLEFNRVVM